ncbi:MAG TPA: TIGR03086 family metal-binding protein [Acidimicrobiales bacterium]|nr:TIGR03086 family metal-binding protein [Acidimicrobiales bacterium]
MDPIAALNQSLDQTSAIVSAVTPEQLGDQTPCSEFDVRALLNHLTGAITALTTGITTGQTDLSLFTQDLIGDDPTAAFNTAAAAAKAAATPAVLNEAVAMPFGTVPGAVALSVATLEALQHGWDLARATGQTAAMDAALAETGIEMAKQFPEELVRQPGVWGPANECSASAPAYDQLAAFLGRQP